jgi:hypothetical protein
LDSGFFFLWWGLDDEHVLDNAKTHVIISDMIKIDVVEIESFVSRKLYTPYTFTVSDSGSNVSKTQNVGTNTYQCNSTQDATVKLGAENAYAWTL